MTEDVALAHAIANHEAGQRCHVLFEVLQAELCLVGHQAQDIILAQWTQSAS